MRKLAIEVIAQIPALILAPMDGLTDAPMRAVQGESGAFHFAVSEFLRVSSEPIPKHVFLRHVPELRAGGLTPNGLPVQVQLLGGDPEKMARSAITAVEAGAKAIDINFGCPAPTVNRHDGGATLLQYPERIRAIVAAVRAALPPEVPLSAKLRLGWDSVDAIHENAAMAAEGGASWLTIHGRTRVQAYAPPADWKPMRLVRERLGIPVVANGDIWTLEDMHRCREETGCIHFMLGRGALADPLLASRIAHDLGIGPEPMGPGISAPCDWLPYLSSLVAFSEYYGAKAPRYTVRRLKQWLNIAGLHGSFQAFDRIKRLETTEALFDALRAEPPAVTPATDACCYADPDRPGRRLSSPSPCC